MRKIASVILVLALMLSLCSCQKEKTITMEVTVTLHGYGIAGQEIGPSTTEYKIKDLHEGSCIIENYTGTFAVLDDDSEYYYMKIVSIEDDIVKVDSNYGRCQYKYNELYCMSTNIYACDMAVPSYKIIFVKDWWRVGILPDGSYKTSEEAVLVSVEDKEINGRAGTCYTHNNGSWIVVVDNEYGISLAHVNKDDEYYNSTYTSIKTGAEVTVPAFLW